MKIVAVIIKTWHRQGYREAEVYIDENWKICARHRMKQVPDHVTIWRTLRKLPEAYLADNGIKHILCRVNHPQTNGKLERFYGVYEQKQHQFKDTDEYMEWHNTIKPHLSLNIENLETPIQAFQRKLPLEKIEPIQTAQDAK